MNTEPVAPGLEAVSPVKVAGHVGRLAPEVTIQKISEEQAGEDQGVEVFGLGGPLRVYLPDGFAVIANRVVLLA